MLKFGVIVLFLVYVPTTVATTCDACKTTYTADKAAPADNPAKCTALAKYLTCLEGSEKNDAGCQLATADATIIKTEYDSFSCSTEAAFTDTCICQKDFWKTDQKSGAAAVCGASMAYIACLKGKTNKACDGSTDVTALATGVDTRITKLGKAHCPVTPTCQCEIHNAESDISTDAKKCTALTALKTCLSAITSTTATGCITGTQATLLTDTNTKLATCAADHVTFAMTSLVVSVLVNMFLWRPSVLAL
ncbi:uncharacterized protein LOC124119315 [Haliotis rufescens]|uniref:uncharacterized protein LOC124119315 n=1 Tax=Haliotis rufescens TaxID=6454 RepID=UPI001EB09451|nr:uncharacterized protein LOC124119315 [Haliotis rufescens]